MIISRSAKPTLLRQAFLATQQTFGFSYDHGEIKRMELKLKKKLQVLRMFSDLKDFDYEPPNMTYDKKTGDIKIVESKNVQAQAGKAAKPKKIIGSMDDLERERKALYAEMGLNEDGQPKNEKEPLDKMSDRLKAV